MNIPDKIINILPKLSLNSTDWKVLLSLLFNKDLENIYIDINLIAKNCEICYNSVVRSITSLVRKDIIIKSQRSNFCSINMNINQWILKEDIVPCSVNKSIPLFDKEGFRKFIDIYPKRKIRLKETLDAWVKLNPSRELIQKIISTVELFKTSDEWKKDNGKWIPSMYNFIVNERWKDELTYQKDWRET